MKKQKKTNNLTPLRSFARGFSRIELLKNEFSICFYFMETSN
ncbi:hypothetical protein LEP1GSC166_2873 [Leptospira kirschneri]|nr:hypothetical protein LEP1GSC166_2873 [Leptospira kirschneri]